MVILYVFIVLLVLLTLLSAFGGSITRKETFVEETTINLDPPADSVNYKTTETFLASPPFSMDAAPFGSTNTLSGSLIAGSGITPTMAPVPLNLPGRGPAPFLAPTPAPVRMRESFVDSMGTMGGTNMGGSTMGGTTMGGSTMGGSTMGGTNMGGMTIGSPAPFTPTNNNMGASNVTFSPSTSMVPDSMAILNNINTQMPKIEMFVDPYDSEDKHARV